MKNPAIEPEESEESEHEIRRRMKADFSFLKLGSSGSTMQESYIELRSRGYDLGSIGKKLSLPEPVIEALADFFDDAAGEYRDQKLQELRHEREELPGSYGEAVREASAAFRAALEDRFGVFIPAEILINLEHRLGKDLQELSNFWRAHE